MKVHRFIRYAAVGFMAYTLEMAVLYCAKTVFGLPAAVAVSISYWVGFFAAFGLQRWIAFENHDKQPFWVARQLWFYGLLSLWNYLFTLGVVYSFGVFASVYVVRTAAIVCIMLWNYAAYNAIFKSKVTSKDAS